MEISDNKENIILIVDDNQKNIQVLGNILREEGYKIAVAFNGYKAIEIAENILPTLILLDIMMPEIDGFQVCENLKSMPATRSIPIVFLTAKVESEDVVEGFRKGGVDYITKPFKKEELLARVRTHITLETTKRQLVTANAQKNRVFSIVSHDLKSPLASFKMLLKFLLDSSREVPREKLLETLTEFKKDVDSIYNMLENLLTWSKNEMEGTSYNPSNFEINKEIKNVIDFLNISAKKKNINVINNISENLTVYADRDMTSLIFRNLLNNALKFSFNENRIEINAQKDDGKVVVSVKDHGTGVPEAKQQDLLSNIVFYTSRGTENEKGSGLGLKLCKSFIEKNKGKLWFDSREGEGSTFYFSLPQKEN